MGALANQINSLPFCAGYLWRVRCDCNGSGWPYVNYALSFRQLCLIIIVTLVPSKSTHCWYNYIDTQWRINGFDVVQATSNEAATENASHSWRQMYRQDKLSRVLFYEIRCSKISFCSTVARIRSFHMNNKPVEYTWPNTPRLVHGLSFSLT